MAKYLDFEAMRERMAREQLEKRGISDRRVLDAFRKVGRHRFVPDEFAASAYGDFPLPIANGQTISQPYMVALMTERLGLKGGERVLEIGTGSGYQTAIIAETAKEVYSVERFPDLAANAERILLSLGYENFKIKIGDGTLGWPECAPYDGIIVTAGAPKVPTELLKQLIDGGWLVIPVGGEFGQMLTVVERRGASFKENEVCGCTFVPLVGKDGWAA